MFVEIRENIAFEVFCSLIYDSDTAFLSVVELDRFVPTCCAMANGTGGWIVLGAALNEDGLPVVEGVTDAASLEKQLTLYLQDSRLGSLDSVCYFRALSNDGKKVLAAKIPPAEWRSRPMCAGKNMT